ncbi:ABC transporter substrate-binding protein [Daeguia caeni]|uniref:ABC transporter substrate-binding protein n=1 Tax=Daeguia caeni TaxID=439612 RepID=A0ABV9H8E0_9HYPH
MAGLLLAMPVNVPAFAAETIRIGFSAPLTGTFAPLGSAMRDGAQVAASAKNAELTIEDDRCDAEGGKLAAERLVKANVQIAGGFLCSESLEAALPILSAHNIPVIATGVSARTLAERRATSPYPVLRLATGLDKEMAATAEILGKLWHDSAFAIIDDGTIEGRERANRLASLLKERQLKPVFTDTYRPGLENQNALVSRLRRAGATKVYVGGERDDVAAIAASAAALKYPLTIAGGSVLDAAGDKPLATDTLMIAPVEARRLATSQAELDQVKQADNVATNYALQGYATVEIAAAAITAAGESGKPLVDILRARSFETVLGNISFDEQGMRRDNPNRLHLFDGNAFNPAR